MEKYVNTNQLIARVKAILTTPQTEWPLIAAEPATVPDLYRNYIVFLAAIPAIAGFIKGSLIGYGMFGFHYRTPIVAGIISAVVAYALSLVLVYVMALIVNALAPSFDGQKDPVQALKAVAYSLHGQLGRRRRRDHSRHRLADCAARRHLRDLPAVSRPVADDEVAQREVGRLHRGQHHHRHRARLDHCRHRRQHRRHRCGDERCLQQQRMSAAAAASPSTATAPWASSMHGARRWTRAGKQMEAAQASGDADAQGKALGAMLGAATGSGEVEALAPERLKPFVPDSLAGLKRTDFSAERNGAMGMQISEAHATYSDGGQRQLRLDVTDMGSAKGLMALAGFAAVNNDRQTEHGYEKTYKQDGRLIEEKWDSRDRNGEYSIVLGQRFTVKVSGTADSIDQLKAAVAGIDLAGLEALKDQGVKKG